MSLPTFHMIPGAPDPVAPFSHAVEVDGIDAQTRQVMENLKRVLAGCGLGVGTWSRHACSSRTSTKTTSA
jgi:enamine deaminase RidA (YjgF/YER057c/UK114 family)